MNGGSGHGGKRVGAGRKPLLGLEERLWIAAEFDRQVAEAAKRAREHTSEADPTLEHIQDFYDQIRDVAIEDRKERAREKTPIGEGEHTIDNLVGDLRSWIDERGSRLVPAPKRIYGKRDELLRAVAGIAAERFGVRISARFVEGCLEEYRRLFPRQRAET